MRLEGRHILPRQIWQPVGEGVCKTGRLDGVLAGETVHVSPEAGVGWKVPLLEGGQQRQNGRLVDVQSREVVMALVVHLLWVGGNLMNRWNDGLPTGQSRYRPVSQLRVHSPLCGSF